MMMMMMMMMTDDDDDDDDDEGDDGDDDGGDDGDADEDVLMAMTMLTMMNTVVSIKNRINTERPLTDLYAVSGVCAAGNWRVVGGVGAARNWRVQHIFQNSMSVFVRGDRQLCS